MASKALSLVARWGLVGAMALMGAALLLTVWSSYAGVREASQTLARGEVHGLQRAVRGHLLELGRAPSPDDLNELLGELAPEGLRFVAALDPWGQVTASAGASVLQAGELQRLWSTARFGDPPIEKGDRLVVALRGGPRRGRGPEMMGRGGGPEIMRRGALGLVFEMQPRRAEQLRQAAARTLAVGGIAAAALLAVALGLVRWSQRQEKLQREMEKDRRLASLGQLSAVLAHEIRNPLASLKGNAQLLAGALPDGQPARAKADRVVSEAIRLEALTNDLLAFARTGEIQRQEVDPAALLREAASALDRRGNGAAPVIEVQTGGAPASWPLDSTRMNQVLTNLLDNALQAGPPVHARVYAEKELVVFEIRDAGPGIADEDREHIFEPFFTRRTRGTGLGLAVVKRVVDLHQGSVSAENAPGGGALFRVSLPRA